MSAISAFYSTWTRARSTFGDGPPETGENFDDSARLRRLREQTERAAPDNRWQGQAAAAYAARNTEHAAVFGRLADLDRRLGTEVTNAAALVSSGRHHLSELLDWFNAAAAAAPDGEHGERIRLILASHGMSQIAEIVAQSNHDLGLIGQRLERLRTEYEGLALGLGGMPDPPEGNPPPVDPLEEIKRRNQVSEDPDGVLDWEPPWPLSMFTTPQRVTATEARMLEQLSLFELQDLKQAKEAAEVEAKVRFPPQNGVNDTADNHTDAFRHAYWNALMTQRFGEQWTKDFTEAHERLPDNPATAEAMDLYNNEVGRKIALANPDASPAELADLVEQAVRRGDTVVIAPDGTGENLAWSNTVEEGGAGTTSPVPVPGVEPQPSGNAPGGTYDPGQPGGYTTSGGY